MKVLVGCERFGRVRDAFRDRGHDAVSCDILPDHRESPHHITGDVLDLFPGGTNPHGYDLAIFFPPCTYLCASGLHWNKRRPERKIKTEEALVFVRSLLDLPVRRIALENPVGCISTRIRKYDQAIQPWMFGEDASKKTCLWLKGLDALDVDPAKEIPPRMINGRPRWGNQTDSGQNKLGPSGDRAAIRGMTYQGIADAMAEQWGA